MNLYEKTIQFVNESFNGRQKSHFERAVYWIEQFIPNATEAHKIAAYSHDIERAFRDPTKIEPDDYLDSSFLTSHQQGGANIMVKFLEENEAPIQIITLVAHLILKHEVGGDAEQNALMDADSVSFFETNAEMFVKEKALIKGKQKVREKLDWMFNRISTEEHKEFTRENYEKWSKELMK